MDNKISVNWDTITGIYDRMPFFPITLIDRDIGQLVCTPLHVGGVAQSAAFLARAGHGSLYATIPLQGSACYCVWGRVVMVMSAWQEAVQAATSHMDTMDTMDTTMYLAHREDA